MFFLSSEQILNENSVSVFQGISTSFWPARLAHLPVEKTLPVLYALFKTDIVYRSLGPNDVIFIIFKRQIVHRTAKGRYFIGKPHTFCPAFKHVKKILKEVDCRYPGIQVSLC